jgi:uncharacterized protein (TIGR02996 family)
MSTNADFEELIEANPDDLDNYRIYGDWLMDHGNESQATAVIRRYYQRQVDADRLKPESYNRMADFLDERGESEDADRCRKILGSTKWLMEHFEEHHDWYNEDYNNRDATTEEVLSIVDEYVDRAKEAVGVKEPTYEWMSDMLHFHGDESLMYDTYPVQAEFWLHLSVLGGFPEPDEDGRPHFKCAC